MTLETFVGNILLFWFYGAGVLLLAWVVFRREKGRWFGLAIGVLGLGWPFFEILLLGPIYLSEVCDGTEGKHIYRTEHGVEGFFVGDPMEDRRCGSPCINYVTDDKYTFVEVLVDPVKAEYLKIDPGYYRYTAVHPSNPSCPYHRRWMEKPRNKLDQFDLCAVAEKIEQPASEYSTYSYYFERNYNFGDITGSKSVIVENKTGKLMAEMSKYKFSSTLFWHSKFAKIFPAMTECPSERVELETSEVLHWWN